MTAKRKRVSLPSSLTTPDLVVLSYLSQAAMHGYELNKRLELHEAKDWASISRPQTYYSLAKLEKLTYVRITKDSSASGGPDRYIYSVTSAGKEALLRALKNDQWATQRPPPPFLTWMALSVELEKTEIARLIHLRREFLNEQLIKEQMTLKSITVEDGALGIRARLMVTLTVGQFAQELEWLEEVEKQLLRGGQSQ